MHSLLTYFVVCGVRKGDKSSFIILIPVQGRSVEKNGPLFIGVFVSEILFNLMADVGLISEIIIGFRQS